MLILKNFMVVSIHSCFGSLSVSGKRAKTAWIHSHCLKALAVLLCAVQPLKAEPFGLFTYSDMGLEIMITGYQQDAVGAVEIPGEIIGKPVTSINTYAFRSCYGVTNVNIPESVTSIGEGAFSHCYELRIVEIPGPSPLFQKNYFTIVLNWTVSRSDPVSPALETMRLVTAEIWRQSKFQTV